MLNTVTGKDLNTSVVHSHWKTDHEGALGEFQSLTEVGIKPHGFRCLIELGHG
jgi:hypothetical protein